MPGAAPLVVCDEVTKVYRRASGETAALDGVSVGFSADRVTALVGPSGSGKSSLLRIVAGLDRPTTGNVVVAGADITQMRSRGRRRFRRSSVGYVFQRPSDNLISYLSVAQHAELAARIRGADLDEVTHLLGDLGLTGRGNNLPHQLSGGEQQRLAFALAAVGAPAVVVADEPTAELDASTAAALMEVVARLARRGSAVILATHDPDVAAAADERIVLDEGRIRV